jgi:hypothetical protein
MKILAFEVENPGVNPDDYARFGKAEARQVWQLMQDERIREIHFRRDQNSAVIFLECQDLDEAKDILDTLPFVKNGLIRFDLIPLRPYPGFERLFSNTQ